MTTARTYHHGNLRAELLERAEAVLAAGDELSLRELARQVGVSHAAPRRHFPDKQSLLDALALDGFERLGRALADALDAADRGLRGRLLAFALTYVRFATEHAALLELMFAGKHADEDVRAASEHAFAAAFELFRAGQASGEIVAGDPERLGTVAFASLHGLAAMVNGGLLDPSDLDTMVSETVERLVLGLAPR